MERKDLRRNKSKRSKFWFRLYAA